ncbi:MAG TPA: tetratricopeptide repeat protein, partial [Planctomycetota bacterium]|nr:tetratricopeptide repeat protein [Planctomycetota bacterium]
EVWKALDTELNRYVALKFLKDDDPSSTVRFQREARTAASLAHAGIASIHEVGEVDGKHFIAMQYVQGRTMAHFPRKDRRLVVRLFKDAARALDHAHRHGVVHRDLKPENLMVEEREDGWHIVILDFGLARPIEGGEKLSKSGEVYGTAAYMSPEQARGEHLDERADVYSLGATMYEVLTGRPPFRGANLLELLRKVGAEEPMKPRKLNPRIHRDLETIILKCLEKDRDRRYGNARELAEDLERFLNSDPILARPPSTLYRLKLTLGKRKAVAITAAAGLFGIAIVTLLLMGGQDRQKAARDRAATHVDLARVKSDQIDQLSRVSEDRAREMELLAAAARVELTAALEACPDHEDALYELGRLNALMDEDRKALECFARAIQLAPRQTKAYLARAAINLNDYENMVHARSDGGIRPETEASKKLLAMILEDLQKIRSISSEVPHLKYAQGLILFAKGKYAEAAERLEEFLGLVPGDVDGWVWRGHALGHTPALDKSIESLTRGLTLRPRMSWALVLRGKAYCDSDHYDEAIRDYDRALALNPRSSATLMNRGNARYLKGEHNAALDDFNKAIELSPGFADAYNGRGNAKAGKGQYDEAILDFTKSAQLNPASSRPHFNLGNTYRRQERFDEAVAAYAKAIELDPGDSKNWDGRGAALSALRRYDEALKDHDKALELDSRNSGAWHNRGLAKSRKRLYAEALLDYNRSLELNPRQPEAWGNRSLTLRFLGRLEEALADQDKAIHLEPGDFKQHVNRGVLRSDMGREEEAIVDYTRAIELNPKDDVAWMDRGLSKFRLGRVKEALADLDEAIKAMPQSALAYAARGSMRRDLGMIDEALADCLKAVKLDPKSPEAHNNLGTVKSSKGLEDEALDHYRRAIELDPDFELAYLNLGRSKERRGLWDEARRDLEKSLTLAPPQWMHRAGVEDSLRTWSFRPVFDEARKLHRQKKYRETVEKYLPIVEAHPHSSLGHTSAFNISCAYALMGDKEKALEWLEKCEEYGHAEWRHIMADTDMDSLREEDRYREVLDRMKRKKPDLRIQ